MSRRLLLREDFQAVSQSFLSMSGNICQLGPRVNAVQSARQKKANSWREASCIECILDSFAKYVGTGFVSSIILRDDEMSDVVNCLGNTIRMLRLPSIIRHIPNHSDSLGSIGYYV